MESGDRRFFTLDVAESTLNAMPVVKRTQLAALVVSLLEGARHVPVPFDG